jgi:ubiquinone/menaquinone biosynthesis C-methylase UbiE
MLDFQNDNLLKSNTYKLNQLIQEKNKLNLGAGTDIRKDFVNIDIQKFPGVDAIIDVIDLSPIEDESVDFIVAQHLLGFIRRKDMLPALTEWRRVLKPHGVLEIRALDISKLTQAMYLNHISPEMGLHNEMVISLLYGQQLDDYDIRYNGFTPSFLGGILVGCGFGITNNVIEDMDFILTAKKK